jgi:hypothetical protein
MSAKGEKSPVFEQFHTITGIFIEKANKHRYVEEGDWAGGKLLHLLAECR